VSDERSARIGATPAGLCGACQHSRSIENDRGSVFVLCERSRVDPAFPRYPRLPVVACPGFDPVTRGARTADSS
jgi:hypothetical protein